MTSYDIACHHMASRTSSDLLCQEDASAAAERERRREDAERQAAAERAAAEQKRREEAERARERKAAAEQAAAEAAAEQKRREEAEREQQRTEQAEAERAQQAQSYASSEFGWKASYGMTVGKADADARRAAALGQGALKAGYSLADAQHAGLVNGASGAACFSAAATTELSDAAATLVDASSTPEELRSAVTRMQRALDAAPAAGVSDDAPEVTRCRARMAEVKAAPVRSTGWDGEGGWQTRI